MRWTALLVVACLATAEGLNMPSFPPACAPPIDHVKGPQGMFVPSDEYMANGVAFTLVEPNWHYADEFERPGMPQHACNDFEQLDIPRNPPSGRRTDAKENVERVAQLKEHSKAWNPLYRPNSMPQSEAALNKLQAAKKVIAEKVGLDKFTEEFKARRKQEQQHAEKEKMETRWLAEDITENSEYPFMVSIRRAYAPIAHRCDGTLIAPRFVLTSALCARGIVDHFMASDVEFFPYDFGGFIPYGYYFNEPGSAFAPQGLYAVMGGSQQLGSLTGGAYAYQTEPENDRKFRNEDIYPGYDEFFTEFLEG
eukprot:3383683-Rhodomonas_salina.2